MTEQDQNQLPDATLTLAITDALCYAHAATTSVYRQVELTDMVRGIFDNVGRGGEVERKPAFQANATIVRVFLDALADYGFVVVVASDTGRKATTR